MGEFSIDNKLPFPGQILPPFQLSFNQWQQCNCIRSINCFTLTFITNIKLTRFLASVSRATTDQLTPWTRLSIRICKLQHCGIMVQAKQFQLMTTDLEVANNFSSLPIKLLSILKRAWPPFVNHVAELFSNLR